MGPRSLPGFVLRDEGKGDPPPLRPGIKAHNSEAEVTSITLIEGNDSVVRVLLIFDTSTPGPARRSSTCDLFSSVTREPSRVGAPASCGRAPMTFASPGEPSLGP